MASSIWHTDGEVWVPKYQIYFGGVMNTPAYVVFEKKKGFDSFFMQSARKEKDYATADAIRAELLELGYIVKNTKDGYEIEMK